MVDSRSFLGLNRVGETLSFEMPVDLRISTGGSFLFGVAGLGACISALETVSKRNLVWATAQYLSFAKTNELVKIDVTLVVNGPQITQGRAVARVVIAKFLLLMPLLAIAILKRLVNL